MRAMRLVGARESPRFDLLDVPEAVAGPGEVVVRVVTAALNRRDWWDRGLLDHVRGTPGGR